MHAPSHHTTRFFDWLATLRARYPSGVMITVSASIASTICTAFEDVQQMSDAAFTAAVVFT